MNVRYAPTHFSLRERHYGWGYAPHPEVSELGFALMPTVFEVMVTPGSQQLGANYQFVPGSTQLVNDFNGRSVASTSTTGHVDGGGIRSRNPLHLRDLPTQQPLTARRNPMRKRRQHIRKVDSSRLGQQHSSNNDSSTSRTRTSRHSPGTSRTGTSRHSPGTSRTRTARHSPGYLTPTVSSLAKVNPKYPGFQSAYRPTTIYTDNRRREKRCVGPKVHFKSDEPQPIVSETSADTPNQIDVT